MLDVRITDPKSKIQIMKSIYGNCIRGKFFKQIFIRRFITLPTVPLSGFCYFDFTNFTSVKRVKMNRN